MVDVYFKKLKKDEDNVDRTVDIGLVKANVLLCSGGISVLITDKELATKIQKAIGQVEVD